MTEELFALLEKVFKHMLSNPQILYGFDDISFDEAGYIEVKQKIPVEVVEVLAIDHYFEREYEEYGVTYGEACRVSDFLKRGGINYKYKLLKPRFHFIVKQIRSK